MKISNIRALRGPNLWSQNTAIKAIISCSDNECNIDKISNLETRLHGYFPEILMTQSLDHPTKLSIAHVISCTTFALQTRIGCQITFNYAMQILQTDAYQIVVEYSEEEVGRLALQLSITLCFALINNTPFNLTEALDRLRELDENVRLGPSTSAIVHAAIARDIPYHRLTTGSMVQLGWGSRQRRIQAAETDLTSVVSESIVQNKELTRTLLSSAGIPVPLGRAVLNAEDAWLAACEIGGSVVIKPRDGNQGKGIGVNLTNRKQVEEAYAVAVKISAVVLVESYISGKDYRMLVIGNKLIAAAQRTPPRILGDGIHNIFQLVEEINTDPRRGEGHANSLTKIRLDEIAIAHLATQGLVIESIPTKGTYITLRNNANLSTGGTATDVTDEVHPEFSMRMIEAAKITGLDICGIDVVCDNVLHPLEEKNGGVIEVNAAPGLRMHLQPSFGKGRAVGDAIIASMFAEGNNARIPIIAVTGTNGKTTTVRLIANILHNTNLRVGMTCTDGSYVEGQRIDTGDCSGPKSAKNILLHPDVDIAVFETARGGLLREGLGFDHCQVAVVTNIGEGDHLGLSHISTVKDLAAIKHIVVQNVTPETGLAVLNASDPIVVDMAKNCPGLVTFFSHDLNNPLIALHRKQKKQVVYLDGSAIVAFKNGVEYRISLTEIPVTKNGAIDFQVENVMATIAATLALDLSWKTICLGLTSFVNDAQTMPGRFNLFSHRGATLVADYGHNPDAMRALVCAINNMPSKWRSVVISAAGDRRDEDIRQQTKILGDAFDKVVIYQDQCQRGRADGEVLNLLRQGLKNAKRTSKISEVYGELAAIDTVFSDLKTDELCLILIDQVEESLRHITQRIAEG